MANFINVVIIKHPNDPKQYMFRVPDATQLKVGDYVLCDTIKGVNQMGRCITPSFPIAEVFLKDMYGIETKNLKPVTALLKPTVFMYKTRE